MIGARDYEIAIEISESLLREYHLTLGEVAQIIAASSLDLPSGSVQTKNGDIMLRTVGQAYVQQDFEAIVLRTFPDGTRLLLGDIANVVDGFADSDTYARFDGKPAAMLNVFRIGEQKPTEISEKIIDYIEQKQPREEYGRYGNPGEKVVERKLARLEGGEAGLVFSSGMAAIVGLLMTSAS